MIFQRNFRRFVSEKFDYLQFALPAGTCRHFSMTPALAKQLNLSLLKPMLIPKCSLWEYYLPRSLEIQHTFWGRRGCISDFHKSSLKARQQKNAPKEKRPIYKFSQRNIREALLLAPIFHLLPFLHRFHYKQVERMRYLSKRH